MNGRGRLDIQALVIVRLANFAGKSKVGNSTDAHFVHKNVIEFDISVDITCNFVQVTYTPDDLAKHHASVIMRQGGRAVSFEDIKKRASGAEEGDIELSERCMFSGE